ncbi:hypothetical protein [Burkholderia ubonensis]|uniref:hypothetical protein n=1 Tax=Burkholderia ubonensis TaxID=101571 RepID=UPI001E35D8CA|nr:hypothetical protein [Burkholderia ubonensis]
MKNLFHALWHPFLHFRALRWFARRGRWLLVMVPLAFALHAGLDSARPPCGGERRVRPAGRATDDRRDSLASPSYPSYPSNIAQTKPPALVRSEYRGLNSGEWSPGSIRVN